MRASQIISKKVYSILEGNEVGYVLNFSLDKSNSRLESLIVVSVLEENEFVLNTKDISAINDDVFITSEKLLTFDANYLPNNPIGKKIFSVNGENMGKVLDVELEKNRVKKIITSSCEIPPKYLFSSGKDCLFFSKSRKKKLEIQQKEGETKVKILDVQLPFRQVFKGEDLIGKTLLNDIIDQNHILIFKKNSTISPKTIIVARDKNLLKSLYENAR